MLLTDQDMKGSTWFAEKKIGRITSYKKHCLCRKALALPGHRRVSCAFHGNVRQMRAAVVRHVQHVDVAALHGRAVLVDHARHAVAHRAEMHRNVRRIRDQAAGAVEDRARALSPIERPLESGTALPTRRGLALLQSGRWPRAKRNVAAHPVFRSSGCGTDPHQSPIGFKASAGVLAFAPGSRGASENRRYQANVQGVRQQCGYPCGYQACSGSWSGRLSRYAASGMAGRCVPINLLV
ncbi:hypothetical protein LMG27177_07124 [Paraburkholderia fynbosensis]|uniref:Uncharacterized protein n=1 Tax=Paraburkholderia fynbosensis TaxID=1200993 RepID=A0A6J5H218_9BURK|nr:hypothetical protein LMG27177_07124 [Paraburkholderia fynbosensis]